MQQTTKSNWPTGPVEQADDQGRQHTRARFFFSAVDGWVARYGGWAVLIFAFLYYSQYYRSGLNLAGEGGTVAMQALRLMEGQRPIVDTFLGYNVMWFYPVVWLFKVIGPNYIALRIYFFCICTAGALLGFFTLRRATGSGTLSFALAAVLVLIPGMLFRNYMPFLGLLNMFVLLQAYVFSPKATKERLIWMAAAGAVVGLTFLFRIDLGLFYSLILAGSALIYPFGVRGKFKERLVEAGAGLVLAAVMIGAVHAPVYLDARARGFGESFLGQYTGWTQYMRGALKNQLKTPAVEKTPAATVATPAPVPNKDSADESAQNSAPDQNGLQRLPLSAFWLPGLSQKAYVLLTYLPILLALLILAAAGGTLIYALVRGEERVREPALIVLTSLGCALALFPQFFFFRPDTPHLSEFMAPFLVALGCAGWFAARVASRVSFLAARGAAALLVLLCGLEIVLYMAHALPKESAGTIAAARKRHAEFVGQNGVRVLLKGREQQEDQAIYDAVVKYSGPEDYVVCYPYAPTINFMTNRRSYEYNVYVDNATASRRFAQEFQAKIAQYKPAVVLIDNRDINKSDSSRFAVWAAPSYEYLRQNYQLVGTFHRQEIYVRPDRIRAGNGES